MKARALTLSALSLLLLVAACGTSQTFGTGFPASGADKFYFHMEQEANARGFDTYRDSAQGILEVNIDEDMALSYSTVGDEIMVTIHVDDLGDGTDDEVADRLATLRQLNRVMVDAAIDRADRARAFERTEL